MLKESIIDGAVNLGHPIRSIKLRIDAGVYPRRRNPHSVGSGVVPAADPAVSTSRRSLRLLMTVWLMPRRANSICVAGPVRQYCR
jgi:hypothetical protein